MKRSSHSKIKNTAIIFDILTRQVISDAMNEGKSSTSLSIIKQHFNKNTILNKELLLYQALVQGHYSNERQAEHLIEAVLQNRKRLDPVLLKKAKYGVIKSMKESYDVEKLFKTGLPQYKLYASIYRIFESQDEEVDSLFLVESRECVVEHLMRSKQPITNNVVDEFMKQDKDIRSLAQKMMVEKFNKKYSILSERQRNLLKLYISSTTNAIKFKDYLAEECTLIKKELSTYQRYIDNPVISIKVKEMGLLVEQIAKEPIAETTALKLMLYYDLIDELKKTINE